MPGKTEGVLPCVDLIRRHEEFACFDVGREQWAALEKFAVDPRCHRANIFEHLSIVSRGIRLQFPFSLCQCAIRCHGISSFVGYSSPNTQSSRFIKCASSAWAIAVLLNEANFALLLSI